MAVTLLPVVVGQNGDVAANNINTSQENLNAAVVPSGGTVLQILQKLSAADYDMQWVDFILNPQNWIDLIPQVSDPLHNEGRQWYSDAVKGILNYNENPLTPPSISGRTLRSRIINNTGQIIPKGKVLKVVGLDGRFPVVELAQANTLIDVQTTLGVSLFEISATLGTQAEIAVFDSIVGVNTIGLQVNQLVYLSATVAGEWTTTPPIAPDYTYAIGFVAVVDAVNGVIGIRIGGFQGSDTGENIEGSLNGMVTQTPNVDFSVSGGIIYADVTNEAFPADNLPFMIGGVRYLLDTTTGSGAGGAARVIVPPGNDPSVGDGGQKSWVYVTLNAGVPELGVSTSKPTVQNAGICTVVVFDAATTLVNGLPQAYRRENNASNSETEGVPGSYGFTRVLADDSRSRGSAWDSGQDPTSTVNDTTIQLALSAGIGKQLHYSGVPLFDGLNYQVYNDDANAITYEPETNLINIVTDAQGGTLLGNGFYYTLRFYQKLNSNGIGNEIIVTRPQGHYSSGELALSDALKYTTNLADTNIEDIVYPLFDLIIGRTGGGGTTVTQYDIVSLRSKTPGVGGGSGGSPATTDDKIRVSAADLINDYGTAKFVGTAGQIVATILNPAGNEQLAFSLADTITKLIGFAAGARIDPNQTFLAANGLMFGDGNTGFYESADNVLRLDSAGVNYWVIGSEFRSTQGTGSVYVDGFNPATATVPRYTFNGDQNTGIGWAGTGQLSLIAGGVEAARIEAGVQKFNGQAIGGDEIKTFASTPEFDFDDGNTQEITVTADITIWTIANDLPAGQYTIYFIQDGTGGWVISDPGGIDKEVNQSIAAFDLTAGVTNIVNIFITPGGVSGWSLVGTM